MRISLHYLSILHLLSLYFFFRKSSLMILCIFYLSFLTLSLVNPFLSPMISLLRFHFFRVSFPFIIHHLYSYVYFQYVYGLSLSASAKIHLFVFSSVQFSKKTFLFSSNSTLSILRSFLFIFPTIFRLNLALYDAMFAHMYICTFGVRTLRVSGDNVTF